MEHRTGIFNALDQFLYARRIYAQERNEPEYCRYPSLTQQIDALKDSSVFNSLRHEFRNVPPLMLFTLPAFQYVFKAAHVLSRAGFDEGDIFELARVLASNTSNNEALMKILKNPVDEQLELKMLEKISFKVAFDYFEDYIDSAVEKLLRAVEMDPTPAQTKEFDRAVRFVTMMIQVSGASEEFEPHVLAIFAVLEGYLLAFGGMRRQIYALSAHSAELGRIRGVVAYGREEAIFPLDGGALDLEVLESELRVLFVN